MKRISVTETRLAFNQTLYARQATRFFVVHHIGEIPASLTADRIDAALVHSWHLEKWAGIGYHYLIKTDGEIQRGRPRQTIGSQCKNHNYESIGICVVGDFTAGQPTVEQLSSLAGLLADLCDIYGLLPEAPETIKGHRDLVDTTCPGDGLYGLLPGLRERVRGLCGH